jgi:hypothetical protein
MLIGSSGCNITNCDEGAICLDEQDEGSHALCSGMCRQLEDCGRLGSAERGECMDACVAELEDEDEDARDYCECVMEVSSCGKLERECGHPPSFVPKPSEEDVQPDPDVDAGVGHDAGGQHDAAPPGDSMSDAGLPPEVDAGGLACTCDDDCADTEGCRDGVCHPKCTASCQCGVGDVCDEGLCLPPPPATMSCQSDCDCPSGERCVELACTAE